MRYIVMLGDLGFRSSTSSLRAKVITSPIPFAAALQFRQVKRFVGG